jgi:STE24 endopeptidase
MDKFKGLLLGLVLVVPLVYVVIWFMERSGDAWWLWAWGVVMAFQFLMAVLAPVLILPLFHKLTPLPEGGLRDRLLELAQRTRFRASNIQVMDGSRRSRHSNAFFTGFGRSRKVVLFDTLIQQLTEPELEAVLAHEIGHYKRRHLVKMLFASAAASLFGFFLLSVLASKSWFYQPFGFQTGGPAVILLLFALLSGVVTFWLAPLTNVWSRKHEYEADAFAAEVMGGSTELVGALRRLTEKNLGNLVPHPFYSTFYYSHPTFLERRSALERPI